MPQELGPQKWPLLRTAQILHNESVSWQAPWKGRTAPLFKCHLVIQGLMKKSYTRLNRLEFLSLVWQTTLADGRYFSPNHSDISHEPVQTYGQTDALKTKTTSDSDKSLATNLSIHARLSPLGRTVPFGNHVVRRCGWHKTREHGFRGHWEEDGFISEGNNTAIYLHIYPGGTMLWRPLMDKQSVQNWPVLTDCKLQNPNSPERLVIPKKVRIYGVCTLQIATPSSLWAI